MDTQLKSQSINAVRWTFLDRVATRLLFLVSTLVLARLLDPKDFGIISMLYIFISISLLFVDSGMGGGLIRKQNLTEADCSTFFYFNVTVAVAFYLVLFSMAPFISRFYKEPSVLLLLRVLGTTIMIDSLSLIHKELLLKELRVKLVTRASLIASVVSTALAIILAVKGFGIWSLVIMQVTHSLLNMLLLWKFSEWVPKKIFSIASLKEFYGFGLGLFLSSFLDTIFTNIYQVLIGKFFSPSYAGLYYQARRLYEVPVLTISNVVDSVTYPILSKYQEDPQKLVEIYHKILKILIFVSVPLVISIVFLADDIVLVLLGKKWLFSAELLQILSLSGIFVILENINRSLFKLEGRTRLIFKLEIVKKVIIVLSILITYRFGIKALMYGMVINSMISFLLNQYFTSIRVTDYNKILQFFINGILMGITIFYINRFYYNPYISIIMGGTLGLFIYFLMGFIMRIQEQRWLLILIYKKIK